MLCAKFMGDTTRVVSGSHDRTLKVRRIAFIINCDCDYVLLLL